MKGMNIQNHPYIVIPNISEGKKNSVKPHLGTKLVIINYCRKLAFKFPHAYKLFTITK